MLLLAHLLRTSNGWRGAQVFLKLVVPHESAAQAARTNLKAMLENWRIDAQPQVIVGENRPFRDILQESSRNADLVFLGMAKPEEDRDYTSHYDRLEEFAAGLPTTIFVLAAPDFAFEEVLELK